MDGGVACRRRNLEHRDQLASQIRRQDEVLVCLAQSREHTRHKHASAQACCCRAGAVGAPECCALLHTSQSGVGAPDRVLGAVRQFLRLGGGERGMTTFEKVFNKASIAGAKSRRLVKLEAKGAGGARGLHGLAGAQHLAAKMMSEQDARRQGARQQGDAEPRTPARLAAAE